ncbi:MmgE/PrpD family protein [Xanthobacter autotrophicus]
MSVVEDLAEFAVSLDAGSLPERIRERARVCVLNGVGMALAGTRVPHVATARQAALAMEGGMPGPATVLGGGRRTGIAGAILANATLFHARTQDDTCGAAHFGATLLPLLINLLEVRGLPSAVLLPALVAGYEVGGALELHGAASSSRNGFRASSIYGAVAAAAAAAKAIGLGARETAAAIANAMSFAGGSVVAFSEGSDEWRYQLGIAALNGLQAACLAEAGSRSARSATEARGGFLEIFCRETLDVGAITASLGADWALDRVMFKPFPVCAFNQGPVQAALELAPHVEGVGIVRAELRMNPAEATYAGMDCRGPFSTLSATLMSAPFCVARTLIHGTPSIAEMQQFDDAGVNALAGRIDLVADADIPRLCCELKITTAAGAHAYVRMVRQAADYSYGIDATEELIGSVFRTEGIDDAILQRLVRFVEHMERSEICDVVGLFRAT